MFRVATIGLFALFAGVAFADDPVTAIKFGKADEGKIADGWTAAKTGKAEGSVWKVVADSTAPSKSGYALAQIAIGPSRLFNLCVLDKSSYKDVEISVAFKAVKGDIDQGGGVMWRYQDADNYYIARFNPLEANLRVYKVIAGKRIQLATKENLTEAAEKWHTLRIEHDKNGEIECYLNGKKLLSVDRENTIDKPGKVGLWTKADAVTYFDDFQAKAK